MTASVGSDIWWEYAVPSVGVVIALLAVVVFIYGIGFNRKVAEPVFLDLQVPDTGKKQQKKKQKSKNEKKAAKKNQQETAEHQTTVTPSTAAKPTQAAPAKKAPVKTDEKPAEKLTKTKERREQADEWERVTSRRAKKAEAEPVPDAAAIEAMTLVGDARAEDSADSGIANASPSKTKKKKKTKSKDAAAAPAKAAEKPAKQPEKPAEKQPAKQAEKQPAKQAEKQPAKQAEKQAEVAAAPEKPALKAPKSKFDDFTTVSKKKKAKKDDLPTEAAKAPEPLLTQEDLFGSGNGKRILSLEEAMSVVMRQNEAKAAEPEPKPEPAQKQPDPKPEPAQKQPEPKPKPEPKAAPKPEPQPEPPREPEVPRPVPIEEMMARLRAGEDITKVSAAPAPAPAPAQPAGKAAGSPPPAEPAPTKENVAFDELGDAWTEQKPKKKKKTRKD